VVLTDVSGEHIASIFKVEGKNKKIRWWWDRQNSCKQTARISCDMSYINVIWSIRWINMNERMNELAHFHITILSNYYLIMSYYLPSVGCSSIWQCILFKFTLLLLILFLVLLLASYVTRPGSWLICQHIPDFSFQCFLEPLICFRKLSFNPPKWHKFLRWNCILLCVFYFLHQHISFTLFTVCNGDILSNNQIMLYLGMLWLWRIWSSGL
jgi:hypothetical protein